MKKRGSRVKLILEVLEYVQKRVNGNIEKQNNIIYLPVYMTYLIKEKERTITEKERTIQILMNKC